MKQEKSFFFFMFWKNSDDANFYGSKMSRQAFCDEILMSMKKIDLIPFRDVLKWTLVKVILKLLILTKLLLVILFIDLKLIVMTNK